MNRRCARPGCGLPATTTLSYAYAQRTVWLDDLVAEDHPAHHDLCGRHADRTQPPRGWELRDRRGVPVAVEIAPESTDEGDPVRRLRYAG